MEVPTIGFAAIEKYEFTTLRVAYGELKKNRISIVLYLDWNSNNIHMYGQILL